MVTTKVNCNTNTDTEEKKYAGGEKPMRSKEKHKLIVLENWVATKNGSGRKNN